MKRKLSFMWRATLALVLVLSLGVVMAAPVAAAVTQPEVTVTDPIPGNTSKYTIVFTTNTALTTAAGDTITFEFPEDGDSGTDTVVSSITAGNTKVTDSAATTAASSVSISGLRVSITPGADVAAGEVTVVFGDSSAEITNPTTEGIAYTLEVYTSQEPVAVTSAAYIIDTVISACTVGLGDADVDTVSAYTITPTLAVAVVENDTITITFPVDTTVPASISDASYVTIDGQDLDAVGDYSVSGQTVTLSVPSGVDTVDKQCVTIFTADALIKNPTSIASDWTVTIYTSKDRVPFTSGTYSTTAAVESHVTQIVWKTTDAYIPNDTCSTAFVIETQDVYGNAATVDAETTFLLDGDGGVFYSGSGCTGAIGTIVIPTNQSESADFFYNNATAGTKTLTADEVVSKGWTMASTDVIINPLLELWGGGELKASYATFALAIAASLPYDTIKVAPSTYEEDFTVDKANLTIESVSGAATTIIRSAGSPNDIVLITAASVTIDGFTIQGLSATSGARNGIDVRASGCTIQNNIFVDIYYDNIFVSGDMTSGTITNNTLTGMGTDTGRGAIWVESYNYDISGITISNNIVSAYSGGLETIFVGQTLTGTVSDITVTGNVVTDCDYGLALQNDGTGTTMDTINVTDNTFSQCGVGIASWTTSTNAPMNVTITGNDITDNTKDGIRIRSWDATNAINYNNISGNTLKGINNTTGTTVVAQHNYWGSPSGPSATANPSGAGDAVSADVNYSPWLADDQASVVASGKSQYATSILLENVATLSDATYSGGWNTFSTPIWLDGSANEWGEITALVTLDYAGIYGWDGTNWTAVVASTPVTPLDAIFVQLKTEAQSLPILFSTQLLPAPTKDMSTGWELVGLANLDQMSTGEALASLGVQEFKKYSQVIDPISGDVVTGSNMVVGAGYWVFMTDAGTLAGFSVTPVPFIAVP